MPTRPRLYGYYISRSGPVTEHLYFFPTYKKANTFLRALRIVHPGSVIVGPFPLETVTLIDGTRLNHERRGDN